MLVSVLDKLPSSGRVVFMEVSDKVEERKQKHTAMVALLHAVYMLTLLVYFSSRGVCLVGQSSWGLKQGLGSCLSIVSETVV